MSNEPNNEKPSAAPQAENAVDKPSEAPPKRVVGQRKWDILQAMAQMLESPQWQKITTAALAHKIGFSEAALYRHYRSKADMYGAILDFIDQSFIDMFKGINAEPINSLQRLMLQRMALLQFAENNPGLTRVLTGEALQNEHEDLNARLRHIITRIEEQWKVLLLETVLAKLTTDQTVVTLAPLIMNGVIGAWWRFSKSGYKERPSKFADEQWRWLFR